MCGRMVRLASAPLILSGLLARSSSLVAQAQERREREPNSVYAERRAKIAAEVDGPISFGVTRPRRSALNYIFTRRWLLLL